MRSRALTLVAAAVILLGGWLAARVFGGRDEYRDLEVRTYALEYLEPSAAGRIVDPYVFPDRGGTVSVDEQTRTVTVRETPEMLSRIAEVLKKYDRPEPSVKLHFRLIEADGRATEDDPRLAEVIEALPPNVFSFKHDRLLGETVMTGVEHGQVGQGVVAGGERYFIEGSIGEVRATDEGGTVRLQVRLVSRDYGEIFTTGVNARLGQLLVLGSAQPNPEHGSLILAVRAELVGP